MPLILNNKIKNPILSTTKSVSGTILPSTYQEVEYIESTGTQYIDTGVIPSSTTNIIMDFEYISGESGKYIPLIGERLTVGSNMFGIWINDSTKEIAINFGTVDTSAISSTNGMGRHTYSNDGNKWYLDGSLINTITTSSFTATGSLFIFALNAGTEIQTRKIHGKLYSMTIYDNETLLRNFIPCYRKTDKELGLYDLVNGVFYTNQGTGTFNIKDIKRVYLGNKLIYTSGIIKAVTGTSSTSSPYTWVSTDGLNWTKSPSSISNGYMSGFTGLCFINGVFVMSHYHGVSYSTDGLTWQSSTVPNGSNVSTTGSISRSKNYLLRVPGTETTSVNSAASWVSSDRGKTFTYYQTSQEYICCVTGIPNPIGENPIFYAYTDLSSGNKLYKCTLINGVPSWVGYTSISDNIMGVFEANNILFFFTDTNKFYCIPNDGNTTPILCDLIINYNYLVSNVVYFKNKYYLYQDKNCYTSTNGLNWTLAGTVNIAFGGSAQNRYLRQHGLTVMSDKLVAVGGYHISYSYDGLNWTTISGTPTAGSGYNRGIVIGEVEE